MAEARRASIATSGSKILDGMIVSCCLGVYKIVLL